MDGGGATTAPPPLLTLLGPASVAGPVVGIGIGKAGHTATRTPVTPPTALASAPPWWTQAAKAGQACIGIGRPAHRVVSASASGAYSPTGARWDWGRPLSRIGNAAPILTRTRAR